MAIHRGFTKGAAALLLAAGCSQGQKPVAAGAGPSGGGTRLTLQNTPLIDRGVLFGNPDKAAPQISPDGKHLAYLAPVSGVMNVWVGPIDDPAAVRPVTDDQHRGIRSYQWAYDNGHVLYVQDRDGDENWHVYASNVNTRETRDLTPIDGVQAQIQQTSPKFPNELLVGLNDRDPRHHDLYRVRIDNAARTLVLENRDYLGFVSDDDFKVRLAQKFNEQGAGEIFKPAGGVGEWTLFATIPAEDALTTAILGYNAAGDTLYMLDSRGRDTAALMAYRNDSTSGAELAADDSADANGVIEQPSTHVPQAVSFNRLRQNWKVIDNAIADDVQALTKVADGDWNVNSRTLDDSQWIVAYVLDNGPVRYYRYDRGAKKATFLFTNRQSLEGLPLARMHATEIDARDGLKLVSYYSLPPWTDPDGDGTPNQALPMILFVHGGPWGRDQWGYHPYHQWLANRGYAVLSVNYRSSTGFGKAFVNAGDREWAGKAHDDLLDAVNWAVNKGIARRDKVAIAGGSYGGYATLVGLTFTPDVFACGVDIVGPSSLITLLQNVPPYWGPFMPVLTTRVGDVSTEEGRTFLASRSPLPRVDEIKRPLLIGQGANDPRVKQVEADQIVKAMTDKNIPVTYVLFPDEGHGFARPANSMAFTAVTEAFLAKHLGGRVQPIGDDFAGSTITVPNGANNVPGLPEALAKKG